MKKVYKKLTLEQINKGVIFSSQFLPNGTLHEVYKTESDQEQTHLRKYKDRPSQTYIKCIGWVRDSKLNNPTILKEIERIKLREIKRKEKRIKHNDK